MNNINEDSMLTVHADNGQTMRSVTLYELFNLLSVRASHGRPHTSNDNAFAESIFGTMKGRVIFPEYFGTIDDANLFTEQFVEWYNYEHKHSGLDYLSPSEVHFMEHQEVLVKRNELLKGNRKLHPSRHGSINKTFQIPDVVELKHRVTLKKVG